VSWVGWPDLNRRPLHPELDALLNVRLLSQLNERVGGSSCLLLSGRVAVLGCCIGSFVVSSAYAAELRITSVFPSVARGFKACPSSKFAGCCWRRSLAVDGRSGTFGGHAHPRRSSLGYEPHDAHLCRLGWSPVAELTSAHAWRMSVSGLGVSPVSPWSVASRAQIRAQIWFLTIKLLPPGSAYHPPPNAALGIGYSGSLKYQRWPSGSSTA
jgi:hypothetical protein